MKKHTTSYFLFIASMLIFGTIGIFRKYIPISSGTLACARGLIGSSFLLLFCLAFRRKKLKNPGGKNIFKLIIIGSAIGINWILLFEAYRLTTVGTATLCYYMQPTIVILLAPLFFKERMTVKKAVCAVVSIVGMVLVSGILNGFGNGASDFKGILFGLGAAAFYASVVIMSKKIKVEDAYTKTIIQLAAAAIVLVPYLFVTENFGSVSMSPGSIAMIVVVGIVHTGVAYALYFAGMQGLNAQSVAVLSYIDPVSALVFSATILGETMDVYGIIGAVLIMGAALICEADFSHIKRKTV